MSFSHSLAHTNPLFLSMEVLSLMKIFLYKVGLIMYKYSNNLLPECISLLYLRNDSIHEHNTRGCHQLRVSMVQKLSVILVHESGMFSLINLTVMFRCQYLNVN